MRKNAGLKSKEEMRKALESGVVLFDSGGNKIFFSKERIFHGLSQYTVQYTFGDESALLGLWGNFAEMEIETPWEEELKNRPILCWVSDTSEEERNRIQLIASFNGKRYKTYSGYVMWEYATPITEEESKKFTF